LCNDLFQVAQREGWETTEVCGAVYDEIAGLIDDDDYSQQDFSSHESDYLKPQRLIQVRDARVRDRVGLVFVPSGEVCSENHWWEPILRENPAYSARWRRSRRVEGDVFYLLGMWSDEYYHWFHDVLPRLVNCQEFIPSTTRFLIHSNAKQYQLDSLRLLGVAESSLIVQPDFGESKVESLWFSTPAGYTTFGSGPTLRLVASRIKAAVQGRPENEHKRIYISRSAAGSRHVANEEELRPLLSANGFTILNLEQLPFETQVEIISRAEVIIGPHGAGLTNLMFANAGCSVGEIATPGVVPCYHVLAKQFECSFSRFYADKGNDEDYVVPVDRFAQWLDSILGSRGK